MTELKPCPFCGGEATPKLAPYIGGGGCGYIVDCDECWSKTGYYSQKAEATEAWNTRAERTCRNLAYAPNVNFECSECGCAVYGGDSHGANIENGRWNVCPNCGKVVER